MGGPGVRRTGSICDRLARHVSPQSIPAMSFLHHGRDAWARCTVERTGTSAFRTRGTGGNMPTFASTIRAGVLGVALAGAAAAWPAVAGGAQPSEGST